VSTGGGRRRTRATRGRRRARATLTGLLALAAAASFAPAAQADGGLYAGVAKVDITPPAGYYTDGYATNDRTIGTWTRLYARALVLREGARKLALVQVDLVAATGGLVQEATALDRDLGYSPANVLVSGTHTHSAEAEFSNYGELDAAFPSEQELLTDPPTFADFSVGGPPDPQVYTFLIHRVALAIRKADENLGPAEAGWSDQQLLGVTQNRSLEAHLANFGLQVPNHQGTPAQDPGGYPDTIDPLLTVLRVDKLMRRDGRLVRVPVGAWTDFANHGTDVEHTFTVYSGDHQGVAERLFESAVRREGHVPAGQTVINAFADGAEGDMSSGLVHNGPAWADHIGTLEAGAMLRGWRQAGRHMSRHLALDYRWTRTCFCGQTVQGGGAIDTKAVIGLAVFTGSEEGRGPLYDATGVSFEGRHLPLDVGVQGDKIQIVVDTGHQDDPNAAPFQVVRIGDHLLAAVPGEPTVELGRRIRAAISAASAGAGIRTIAIVGLANEYVAYYTTPAEYEYQDYEGAHTVYGLWSGYFVRDQLADLAGRLARGQPAPDPYPFDPTNGVKDDGAPYSAGAAGASATSQPAATRRLDQVSFGWQGGPRGLDRPLDRAFITLQRRRGRRWVAQADDLGFQIVWTVSPGGVYTATWQVPFDAPVGRYRFLVTANRYRLASDAFSLKPSTGLAVHRVRAPAGRVTVELAYPPVPFDSLLGASLLDPPAAADGGTVEFRIGRRVVKVTRRAGTGFSAPAPAGARVAVIAARDRFGNRAPAVKLAG